VSWEFGASGTFAYVLNSFEPADAGLGTVGASNPTLILRLGQRYTITVADRGMHPLELIARGATSTSDEVLLSMAPGVFGSLENDSGVAWQDDGLGPVSFTLTRGLYEAMSAAGRVPGYRCRPHGTTMRGSFDVVGLPLADPIPGAIPKGSTRVELQTVVAGLAAPVALVHVPGPSSQLLVADQVGLVYRVEGGSLRSPPFLDLRAHLVSPLGIIGSHDENDYDERGLLGLALHPGFADPASPGYGRFYTFTSEPVTGMADMSCAPLPPGTVPDHQNVVAEWQADAAEPGRALADSRRAVLRIDHPQFNHNGGMLAFGPDGYLYIAVGDGGNANDSGPGHGSGGNGQDLDTPHGSILRIDPLDPGLTPGSADPVSGNGRYRSPVGNPFVGAAGPDEVYAFGFRNPFRFSFDLPSGRFVAGDVGQNHVEEVDIVVVGGNYGWRLKEGSFRFDPATGDVTDDVAGLPAALIDPVLQYDHDEGLAVVGGHIYRGSAFPGLEGRYLFGDFSRGFGAPGGRLFAADLSAGVIEELAIGFDDRPLGLFLRGFGEDSRGELHVLASARLGPAGHGGLVLKLVPERFGPPTLTLLCPGATIAENGGVLQVTVARNPQDGGGELALVIEASPPARVSVPSAVTLPAGAAAVSFPVAAVDNPVQDGDAVFTLTVSAEGVDGVSIDLTVTDDDPPPIAAVSPGVAEGTGTGVVAVPGALGVAEGSAQTFTVTMVEPGRPYRYTWLLNGAAAPGAADRGSYVYSPGFGEVAHPSRSADLVLACTVADSGGGPAATATWRVVRVTDTDRPPPAPRVGVAPAEPRTGDDLTANVLEQAADPDGDGVSGYAVVWEAAGGPGGIAGSVLDNGHTRKGQSWQATVRALTDPYGEGAVVPSEAGTATASIGNTPPQATSQWGLTLPAEGALALQLRGTDPDADEGVDSLTFSRTEGPFHGDVDGLDDSSGTASYLPGTGHAGSDRFSFVVSDGTATSAPASVDLYVYSGWVVTVVPAGGSVPVQLGVEAGATAGVDSQFDVEAVAAEPGLPRLVSLLAGARAGASSELARDIRGPVPPPAWLLLAEPGAGGTSVSWADADLPEGGLWLWEVAEPDAEAPPLAGTLVDMAATRELALAAGPVRYFVAAQVQGFVLALSPGWNLISLPVEPDDRRAEVVLAAPPSEGGTVYEGFVWTAEPNSRRPQYIPVRELQALTGYWLYAPNAAVVAVAGRPTGVSALRLHPGWNLVAVPAAADLPADAAVLRPTWGWEDGAYRGVTQLQPGLAYWVLCTGYTVWDAVTQ
jgi:glucose/arabinose dehydrogenase